MCIILFAYKITPGYRLILAANRDEFLHRPTAPLAWWAEHEGLLAGRDLQAGGTWLGMQKAGKFAALTNYREPQGEGDICLSRGEIPLRYLSGSSSSSEFLHDLRARAGQYNGFNLLFGRGKRLYSFSNRGGRFGELEPGIYGLSNHLLDSKWPKVERGKKLLQELLNDAAFTSDSLFVLLQDRVRPPDELLPDTGLSRDWESLLSTIFIAGKNYGTRSSAVIILREDGQVQFRERTYLHGADGFQQGKEKYFSFALAE